MTTTTYTPLRDAMYAMSLAKSVPDADLLDDFVRRYPQHADALTEFAIELAVDAFLYHEDSVEMHTDPDIISPVVSRAISRFQNRLFEIREGKTIDPATRVATSSVENPFSTLDREQFRGLVNRMNVNSVLLSKLRDRQIDPETIPARFSQYIAETMSEALEKITTHFYAPPVNTPTLQFYKSTAKPKMLSRQSFEEAIRGSGLSDQQKQHLSSFRD